METSSPYTQEKQLQYLYNEIWKQTKDCKTHHLHLGKKEDHKEKGKMAELNKQDPSPSAIPAQVKKMNGAGKG